MKNEEYHEPVLVHEVLGLLAPLKNARIIDATLGTGGHTLAFIKEDARVLGIDADNQILEVAERRLEAAYPSPHQKGLVEGSFRLIHANFKDLDKVAIASGYAKVDAVLFDLGVTNIQLTSPQRGISFSAPEAPLDMRIDRELQGVTGADLLNGLREDQLTALFAMTLERGASRWLTKRILSARENSPISCVGDFLDICQGLRVKGTLHEATLPFLALRMAVNSERENLIEALPKAFSLLISRGKLLVITFHSGEERIVLDFYHKKARMGEGKIVSLKPIIPTPLEVRKNPRARSAELWVLQKK